MHPVVEKFKIELAMIIKKDTQLRILKSIVNDIKLHPSCTAENLNSPRFNQDLTVHEDEVYFFGIKGKHICYMAFMPNSNTEIRLGTIHNDIHYELHTPILHAASRTVKLEDPEISQKCEEFINGCITIAANQLDK